MKTFEVYFKEPVTRKVVKDVWNKQEKRWEFDVECDETSDHFTMYSLTAAWGNVGQAVAVVIMVIQVAGAGGTFPVEVLPQVYRALYKFMPFNYAMNALRECVGGMYRFDYGRDLAILLIFIAVSLVIGLLLGCPFGKLNTAIEKSKKKSGLIL